MSELIAAWLIFPATCLSACVGAGMLVRRLVGPVPSWALPPLGLAALVCATQIATAWSAVARVAVVIALAAAVVGVVGIARAVRRRVTRDTWLAAGAAAVLFAVAALPVVASGQATVAGYGLLGDTVVQLLGADLLVDDGRDLGGLAPSATRQVSEAYFVQTHYPTGALTAFGALAHLNPEQSIWLYQPFLGFLLSLLAFVLFGLARQVGLSSRPAALVAAVAAQPALLYAYYLQGSIKELAAAMLIALVAWGGAWFSGRGDGWRPVDVIPVALAAAALIAVFGLAAGVWLAPAALVLIALRFRAFAARPRAFLALVMIALAVLFTGSVQSLQGLGAYVETAGAVTTSESEFGNLLRPLELRQALGVWLQGDYRLPPGGRLATLTSVWGWAVLAAAMLGLGLMIVRRRAAGLLYLGVSGVGAVAVLVNGSPWADGKALAIAGPAVAFAALTGLALAAGTSRTRSLVALGVGAVVAAGVVWSNALAYHDVSLAPRDRLEELAVAGQRAGPGALVTEFEEYAKYVLRDRAPEVPLDVGGGIAQAEGAEAVGRRTIPVDRLDRAYLQRFPAIIARRDPFGAPPSSAFERVWTGRWYEVWRRIDDAPPVLGAIVPATVPGTQVACADIGRLAADVPPGGRLVAQPAAPSARALITSRSRNWPRVGADGSMQVVGPGEARGTVRIPQPGTYRVWLGGRFGRAVRVDIGGRRVGSVEYRLSQDGATELAGTARLPAGTLPVLLTLDGPDLRPGNGMVNRFAGPVDLVRASGGQQRQIRVAPERWRRLCDRRLRWVEATGPPPVQAASSSGPVAENR